MLTEKSDYGNNKIKKSFCCLTLCSGVISALTFDPLTHIKVLFKFKQKLDFHLLFCVKDDDTAIVHISSKEDKTVFGHICGNSVSLQLES